MSHSRTRQVHSLRVDVPTGRSLTSLAIIAPSEANGNTRQIIVAAQKISCFVPRRLHVADTAADAESVDGSFDTESRPESRSSTRASSRASSPFMTQAQLK